MPQPIQTATMKNYFEDIYQAALLAEHNYVNSYQLVNSIYQVSKTVDVHSPIYKCVPSYKLAAEGKHKAVELLMRFGTELNHVVTGAASGGNEDWAMNLCRTYNVKSSLVKSGLINRNLVVEMDKNISESNYEILESYLFHAAVQSSDYFLIKYFLKTYIIPLLKLLDISSVNPDFDYLYSYINHPDTTDTPVISTEPLSRVLFQDVQNAEKSYDTNLIKELNTQVERILQRTDIPISGCFLSKYMLELYTLLTGNDYVDELNWFKSHMQKSARIAEINGYHFRADALRSQQEEAIGPTFFMVNLWEAAQKATAGRLRYPSGIFVDLPVNYHGYIAQNFAFWGYFAEAEALRTNNLAYTRACIIGAIRGGHFDYAFALLKINKYKHFPIWFTAVIECKQFKFIDTDSLDISLKIAQSRHLCFGIRNVISKYSLVAMLNNSPNFTIPANMAMLKNSLVEIFPKIPGRYRPLDYNYFELLAYARPEIIIWFHHGNQLKRLDKSPFNLPQPVFDLITMFLSPMLPNEATHLYNTFPKYLERIKYRPVKRILTQLIRKYSENPAIFKPQRLNEFKELYKTTHTLNGLCELLATELAVTSQNNYPYSDYHKLIVACCQIMKKQQKYSFNSLVLDPKIKPKQYDIRDDTEEYRRVFIENYLQEYNNSFFKNPLSSMLKEIKDNTITYRRIQQHARNNPDSRTRQIVDVMEAQGKDLPQINRFKQEYLADYHSKFFKNPFSTGRKNLSSITSVKQIIKYSESNPNSRTASILKRN